MQTLRPNNQLIRRIRNFRSEERGAILVEFGLILPIMLLFFGLMIEGSRLLWSYQAAVAGVRDAGRYLSRVVPADICSAGGSVAGYATKVKEVVEKDLSTNALFSTKVTINSVTPSYTCQVGSYRNSPVAVAKVTASMRIDFPLADILSLFGGSITHVTTSFAELVQGVRAMSVQRNIRALWRDQSGSVLVEFAVVIALFSFLFYVLIDFGRLSYAKVNSEKAAHLAARIAVVRPAACAGVPEVHGRGVVPGGTPAPVFGTSCSVGSHVCAIVATVTCAGSAQNSTAQEIWTRVEDLMPSDATIANLQFSYSFDPNLGFLGGPYTPMVTVDITPPAFQFISPLGALAAAVSGSTSTIGSSFAYPAFSVSLPAEDLNIGVSG